MTLTPEKLVECEWCEKPTPIEAIVPMVWNDSDRQFCQPCAADRHTFLTAEVEKYIKKNPGTDAELIARANYISLSHAMQITEELLRAGRVRFHGDN